MIEKIPSDQSVIGCLYTEYGIEVATLTLLPLGADMHASVYKAQGESAYFVKLKQGHHDEISVAIVELLHAAGIQPIIPPIKTIQGQSTKRVEGFTLIVYPFVEGVDGFHRALADHQWIQLGKALRQVHDIAVPPSLQHRVRREVYSPQWRNAVRALHLEKRDDRIAEKLWEFIQEKRAEIRRLVDRAEQLAHELRDQAHPFVLCHSDIHGGNVLLDGNERFYIVDWDEPIMAPKERDLMFIGGGVGNMWNKAREEKLFYQGYGPTEVNPKLLAYYRHERIVEDIAEYGQKLLLTTEGGEERPEMYKQFIDMFKPEGVVDKAFQTN